MIVLYDFRLIVLSIAVAILAAHAGLLLLNDRERSFLSYKAVLVACAIIIGGGIWTMHFIGMLALHAPVRVDYTVLPTLISAMVPIVFTGLSLYCATSGVIPKYGLPVGAVLMGGAIASMHYTGMEALRTVCTIEYTLTGIVAAILVGISASWLALKCMQYDFESRIRTLAAATALGLAISAMHYVAMFNTQFTFIGEPTLLESPVLNTTFLASIVALATFLIVNSFLLIALPSAVSSNRRVRSVLETPEPAQEASALQAKRICLGSAQEKRYIDIKDIVYVTANGHYTKVGFETPPGSLAEEFCDTPLSKLAPLLDAYDISQYHRSHLVNLHRVSGLRKRRDRTFAVFSLSESLEIPISRTKVKELSTRLAISEGVVNTAS